MESSDIQRRCRQAQSFSYSNVESYVWKNNKKRIINVYFYLGNITNVGEKQFANISYCKI